MSNVILYESTATDFFNQGLGPLEAKDPKVTEVGNGEFYLELDYPTTGRLFNQLKNGNLIKSDAGHELKDQRFEIKRVVKSMKKGYVSVYAEHISNQALDIALPTSVTLSGAAQTALQQAQNSALGSFKPFTMSSDITTTNNTTLSIKEFKNLKQALGGVEGSILDIWGGEYKFDNYHISLFKKRGRQANAMIAYGRNLIDLEQEENIMNTFTSVYPYAVWRDDEGVEHIIEGSVIHSEHADIYPHHKVLPVDFTLEAEDDTKPTATKLNQLATAYIENNDIGIPEVSIKLTHLDLSKTLDYKEYAEVEKLNVFDEVKIYFADFDINTTAKIVRTVWNVNLRRYDEIEVGKVRASLSDRINTIDKQVSKARQEAEDARNVSSVAANGVNMIFFGPDEPTATKIGDRWFMEDGQYTISKVWDGVIWRVISDPRLSDQNAQLIGEQQAALEEVKTIADYSYDQLQQTIANSGFTDLDTAFGNVKTLSEQAESNAYNAMQKALDNASLIGGLDDSISNMSVEINDINNSLTFKANTTDIDRIDGTITDINNELIFQSGVLSSKVSQTVYNEAIGNIETTQTELTQTFEDFETSVIGPTGRLTLAEQFLDGFRNTAFDPETGQLSLTEQTIAGLQSTVSDPVNGLETKYTQLSGLIDLRVTSAQAKAISEAEILADKTIKDTRNDNQTPEWYFNNYPKQVIEEFKYRSVIGVPGLQTYGQLTTNIPWSDSSGGYVIQIFKSADGTFERRGRFTSWNDWEKIADTSYVESQFSILDDKILAKVSEGDVYSQLLIDSRNILFDANDRIMLSANKVLIDASEGTFITGAVINDAAIDTAKIADLAVTSAKIINLDVDKIVGNTTNFVRSAWEAATGGGVYIQGEGIRTISSDGSSARIQNGALLSYQPNGAGIGFVGYSGSGNSPFYTLTTSWGSNFRLRSHMGDGTYQSNMEIYPGSNEIYLKTNYTRVEGELIVSRSTSMSGDLSLNNNALNRVKEIVIENGGYIRPDTSAGNYLYRPALFGNNGVSFGVGTSSSFSRKMMIDSTRVYMYQPLNMQGHGIFEQSDRRYKTNVKEYTKSSLDIIKPLRFITYEYTGENMASGIRFGLIAQESGALGEYDPENDMWGINTSKQIMHNSHAIQEIANEHDKVVTLASKAYLKAESNEERIEKLEAELKLLKGAS